MRLVVQAVTGVSKALGVVAALFLLSAVLSVSQMVFVRYVLNESTVWQTEYTAYAIVAATFLGAPWVLTVRGHVNVDLWPAAAGARMRVVLEAISGLASLLFVGLIAYAAFLHLEESWVNGWTSDSVWAVPLWMPVLPFAVGMGWLFLQYVAELIRLAVDGPVATDMPLTDQNALFSETVGAKR